MRVRILPWKVGSRSAAALSETTGYRRLKLNGRSRFVPRRGDVIINWGNGSPNPPHLIQGAHCYNRPQNVALASNKLRSLELMRDAGVRVPRFTLDEDEAQATYQAFIARTRLTGSGGIDAHYVSVDYPYVPQNAVLFTEYIPKIREERVHVFNGVVIDRQQKRLREGIEYDPMNFKIRNHDRGWVFCRNHVDPPIQQVLDQAVEAVRAVGLDFGAVDVVYNQHYDKAYVLEINTAPGLEGTTVERYAEAILNSTRGYAYNVV